MLGVITFCLSGGINTPGRAANKGCWFLFVILVDLTKSPFLPRPMVCHRVTTLQLGAYWWYSSGSVWMPSGNTQRLS